LPRRPRFTDRSARPLPLARSHRRRRCRVDRRRRLRGSGEPDRGLRGRRPQRRRVTSVVTDAGEIATECVINAAGMWGGEIAAMVGTRVPACAVEHQYLVTAKSDRIPAGLPSRRDPDGNFYLKPEPGAFAVGGWEHNTPPWGADGIRTDFGPELLQPDFDRFAP